MRPEDVGTTDDSVFFVNTPTAAAKSVFLYPTLVGHYYCTGQYRVERSRFDSFLLLYVKCGSGFVEFNGIRRELTAGSAVLLDCYKPHAYFTTRGWEINWVHFDGIMARKYFEAATQKQQIIAPSTPASILTPLNKILEMFLGKRLKDEALLAKYLTDLLTEFIRSAAVGDNVSEEKMQIEESLRYISEHLNENLTLQQLADHAILSPFYFSRLFKEKTGFTPYQYLIMVRLDYACYLLRNGSSTIKEIAYRCGFHSESNFCTSFRKVIGTTPKLYRSEK